MQIRQIYFMVRFKIAKVNLRESDLFGLGKILEICKAPIVNIEYFMICRNWKTVSVQLSFQYPELLEMCWDLFPCSYF